MSESVDAYDYDYPEEAVAQEPAGCRDDARLLHVARGRPGELAEGRVAELPEVLGVGDLLVLNEVRVRPARLRGRRAATSGAVSVLVLESDGRRGVALLGARGKLACGERLVVGDATWRLAEDRGEGRFAFEVEQGPSIEELMDTIGRMPLPPYIRRDRDRDARDGLDRERYQTVYASREGPAHAVAAPTAGLHFTGALLERLGAAGVAVARLSLHVGEGTFRPMRGETVDEHRMHVEHYEVPDALARAYGETRAAGGRVVAVGTTVVRALESAVVDGGAALRVGRASTDLFIRPGHRFAAVDALVTNFHQPRSTLLVLVSAFAGREVIRRAYRHAIASGFRLFSYGDAMLVR